MDERPRTALIFNDMVNANVNSGDDALRRSIADSGVIEASVWVTAEARRRGLDIFWFRFGKREDGKDLLPTITDRTRADVRGPEPRVLRGTAPDENIPELPVREGDFDLRKPRMDPFFQTDLDFQLRALGVRTVLLGGISTAMGVESGARSARDRGYDVVVLSDCCYAETPELHLGALEGTLPFFARIRTAAEAIALLDDGAGVTDGDGARRSEPGRDGRR